VQERTKLDGLTAARFYAALMIVIFHVAAMPELSLPQWLESICKNLTLGVPLFFLVSAFSMCFGYSGKLGSGEQVRDYAIRRFFRIAPLFYLMMAVYVVYLYAAYGVRVPLVQILTSLTFTFNLVPSHVSGFVWASWTIGIEMAFYCVFPLLAWTITSTWRAVSFFVVCAAFTFVWTRLLAGSGEELGLFRGYFFMAHMVTFAGGILAYFVWSAIRSRPAIGRVMLAAGLVALAAMLLYRGPLISMVGGGTMRSMQVMPLAMVVIGLAASPTRALVNRFTTKMGEASFSLYLFHPLLIGILMNGGFYKWIYRSVPDAGMAYGVCVLATLAILFPAALLGFKYIEVPGNRLGARLIDWLHRRDREALSEDSAIAGR
jgi:peptidoglycan/LPS O-acetylase OafA/YrhL